MFDRPGRTRRPPAWFAIQIALIGLLAAAAGATLSGARLGAAFAAELAPRLGLDRLSAVFLLLVCLLGLASALAGLRGARLTGWLGLAFVAAMALLVAARDALTFLAAWELMSLAPAAAILAAGQSPAARKGVLIYVGTTHLGGAGVWLGMLYLAQSGLLAGGGDGSMPPAIAIACLIGCATKAGIAPLHFWLPRAHPLAPASISALMSGAMVALPLYAIIRLLFQWMGPTPAPAGFGWALIGFGLLSALLGAYSAAMAAEMKRLLAFSTVENVGLAALAIGLAAVLAAAGKADAAGLALAIAIFGLIAHGVAKSALFLAAGALGEQLGRLDLGQLGGLGRRMPQAATALVLGALSLAAIPPLAGFAAEWALLRALMDAIPGLGEVKGTALAAVAAGVALVAGLAALAFCKLIGLTLLGEARRSAAAEAGEPALPWRLALALGAGGALAIGLFAGYLLPWLERQVSDPLVGGAPLAEPGAALQLAGGGALPGLGLAIAILVAAGLIWRLRGPARSAPAQSWACGQPPSPRLRWSGAGFVQTLRMATAPQGFEWRAHRPALAWTISAAALARRLHSGRLRAYLLYLALTLIVALAAARLELL